MSDATTLIDADQNGFADIYIRDRDTDDDGIFDEADAVRTWRVSVSTSGAEANGRCEFPHISEGGDVISFESEAWNLVEEDFDVFSDIYARDRCPGYWGNYGAGWPGHNGIPSLTMNADPILGTTVDINIDNSAGFDTVGFLFIGLSRASVPAFDRELLVSPSWLMLLPLPAQGLALPAALPDDESLCRLAIDLQVLEQDPAASSGVSFTPGLEAVLGRR